MLGGLLLIIYRNEVKIMRIAIIGAGALGSYLGYKLHSGGHEVVLCDRGRRAEEIRKSGVRLKDVLTGQSVMAKLMVEEEPQGEFDVVVVTVRAHQMTPALSIAAEVAAAGDSGDEATGSDEREPTTTILLVGSYVSGMSDWAEELGEERVLLGFPGMSAVLERDATGALVRFCERGEDDTEPWGITVGKLREPVPDTQVKACRAMNAAGIAVHHAEAMESVFLSQALVRLPMLAALRYAGGKLDHLSGRGDLLKLMIKASREGLSAVKRSGLRPVPDSLEMYRWVPVFISANMIKHRLDTLPSKIGIEAYSKRAGNELRLLAGQFLEFVVASGSEFEHVEYLLSGFDED